MGGNDTEMFKKPSNTFSILQMKMNEIEKSKKLNEPSTSKSNQNSSTSNKSSYSLKTTPSKILKKSSLNEEGPREDGFPKLISRSSGFAFGKMSRKSEKKKNTDPDVPDRTYGDFFCSICDSHMNSDAMWEAHITGKRHLKNVKKGDPDPKYEELDVESNVRYEIRNVKDPIIGLSYVHEIRRKESGAPPLYTCFLCQATFASVPMVVEHVISMKHRLNYMKENSPDDYQLLDATNLKKGHMEPLVHEVALKLEQKFGRGCVKVKQERIKPPFFLTSKRANDSDDDDDGPRKMSKSQKYEDKKNNPYIWKSVDYQKKDNFKDVKSSREISKDRRRSYSSDEEDAYRRHDYTKRSQYDDHTKRSQYDDHLSKYESTPPRDSLKRETFYPRTPSTSPPPLERYPHSRSYKQQEKVSQNADDYPVSSESKAENSNSQVLKDFVQKVYALPSEIFLKIVLLKLENIDIKGIDELSLLSKLISKAQAVLCNKLPPDVQAVLKQRMSQNSDSNVQKSSVPPPPVPQATLPVMSQVAPPLVSQIVESSSYNTAMNYKPSGSQSQGADFGFIKDLLNRAKVTANSSSSTSENIVPHQTPQTTVSYQSSLYPSSYQNGSSLSSNVNYSSSSGNYSSNANYSPSNVNYPYNSTPSSTASGIPGLTLTEENRDAQSSYTNYQSQSHQPHFPDPPSNYPPYRY